MLYGTENPISLDELRFKKFTVKVASSTSHVEVKSLPPTSAAAKFHSLRVYFQTKVWIGDNSLNPLDYGWQVVQGKMLPLKSSLPPAPDKLLSIIYCNCKLNCDTKKCSCRKHGLECSNCCGGCRGVSCLNSVKPTELDIDENETSME